MLSSRCCRVIGGGPETKPRQDADVRADLRYKTRGRKRGAKGYAGYRAGCEIAGATDAAILAVHVRARPPAPCAVNTALASCALSLSLSLSLSLTVSLSLATRGYREKRLFDTLRIPEYLSSSIVAT